MAIGRGARGGRSGCSSAPPWPACVLQRRARARTREARRRRPGRAASSSGRATSSRDAPGRGGARSERSGRGSPSRCSAAEQSIAREQARLDDELGTAPRGVRLAVPGRHGPGRSASSPRSPGRQGEERDRTLRATVAPVADLLARFEQHVHEVEKERKEAYGSDHARRSTRFAAPKSS